MATSFLPLQDLTAFFDAWNFHFCFLMHCLWASHQAKWLRGHFLLHFWVTYLCAFGGALTTSLLLMRPEVSGIPLLDSNTNAVLWLTAWWSVNHFPFGIIEKFTKLRPVWVIITAGSAFCRSLIIASRVEFAVRFMPGNHFAALVMGTMASTAGKFLSDGVLTFFTPGHRPKELLNPGFVLWSGIQGTCFYYLTAHVFHFLAQGETRALLCTLLVSHAILSNATSMSMDFTVPFKKTAMVLSHLPSSDEAAKEEAKEAVDTSKNGSQSKKNR